MLITMRSKPQLFWGCFVVVALVDVNIVVVVLIVTAETELQKDFQIRNVQIMYLLIFAITLWLKLNKYLFFHQFSSFGVDLCHKSLVQCWSLFMQNMLRLATTIWKCLGFLLEMADILDTRVPPYWNSELR